MDLPDGLKNEPDAILLRERSLPLVDERLNRYTVPLTFLTQRDNRELPVGNGTGVLIQLDGRKFILTAGHVVTGIKSALRTIVGIRKDKHRFVLPDSVRMEYVYEPSKSADYGFIELDSATASSIEAAQKIFAGPNSLVLTTSQGLRNDPSDWFIMAGFPGDASVVGEQATGYSLVHTSTTLAGIAPAPPSTMPPSGVESVDLWVPEDMDAYWITGKKTGKKVPRFGGASGGGTWKAGVRPISQREWKPEDMRLCGIHIGSTKGETINGIETRFSRSVLIGHHLKLISKTTAALAPYLLASFPALGDGRWS